MLMCGRCSCKDGGRLNSGILFLTKSEIVDKIQANKVSEDELIDSDSGS
jgi:hypothetical protein